MDTRWYFPILAVLSAILVLAPLRTGDLTGYDDAQYAHIAKDILRTGDWLVLHSNGEPALENPPLLEWVEASLFAAFGFSDALAVAAVAAFPRTHFEAAEIRPIAKAATAATAVGERVAFYDAGQPRFDEDNQMQWYGDRFLVRLFSRRDLLAALRGRRARVFVLDRDSCRALVTGQIGHQVVAESGHLICIRLTDSGE